MITITINGPQGALKTLLAEAIKSMYQVRVTTGVQIYDGEKLPKKEKPGVDVQIVIENR